MSAILTQKLQAGTNPLPTKLMFFYMCFTDTVLTLKKIQHLSCQCFSSVMCYTVI